MPACLIALTPAARRALGGDRCEVARYPFRVGRECRRPGGSGTRDRPERRSPDAQGINDVYLDDAGRNGIDVSREHFQIEHGPEGHTLVDRSSACGTLVEGRLVGGDRTGGRTALRDHDVIVVGSQESPFVFKFRAG